MIVEALLERDDRGERTMELFEAIHTLRAMRRLKPDPVPAELITRVLAAGTQAPSGQNTQPWRFVVVRDPAAKAFVQERYHRAMLERFGAFLPLPRELDVPEARSLRAALYLSEHLHETPVLLVVCGKRDWPAAIPPHARVGKAPPSYGSLYPCIQNILLACRALGLGANLTTMHMLFEAELANYLGVPDDHGIVAIVPIGYPRGKFGPLTRRPVEEVTYYDRWGNPPA
jgi:nitroreductase